MPRWLWILLFVLTAGLVLAGRHGPAAPAAALAGGGIHCPLPPGYGDPAQPRQSDVGALLAPFRVGDAQVSPLAGFSLQARVLHREDYSFGPESRYSPTDLALGWGPMAAPGMADYFHVSQGGRWYRYHWSDANPPVAPELVARTSSNMHIVPADDAVARALSSVRAGELLRIDGWLIRIDRDDGWHWSSSTSREDTGSGACELVLACAIRPLSQ